MLSLQKSVFWQSATLQHVLLGLCQPSSASTLPQSAQCTASFSCMPAPESVCQYAIPIPQFQTHKRLMYEPASHTHAQPGGTSKGEPHKREPDITIRVIGILRPSSNPQQPITVSSPDAKDPNTQWGCIQVNHQAPVSPV